ncbi:uncharacterized membrane protein YhaH (DUF805 family) [Alkalihalobacillus xiaoxiensis]|uniref:Uncharacterized membrane protein YhaH (DUF805 family) n=1 Tax=Shouchella xiaoxiensis TaxID=766895 RepID=A0ABS2SZS6_9BACI|nr:hypothetical protein [Shouchella xiaoxiensis]MBM7840755.1 uncharacterized membrane protein YhaH (DUF805 family) [Shouchella xiaoxiensis]
MKNYPLWFWISLVVVMICEVCFILFGPHLFDRPVIFLQSALVMTFVLHPLYMIAVSALLWRQKHDARLLLKACLLMLLPVWIAWFLFLAVNETG